MTSNDTEPVSVDRPLDERPTLRGHVEIMRIDHWFKNVFTVPGMVIAWFFFDGDIEPGRLLWSIPVGLLALSIVASANYVINEVLDAPFDRHHPVKRHRAVPSGRVSIPLAYGQWFTVGAFGIALSATLGSRFMLCAIALFVMGIIYNVPPVRTKDAVIVDVMSESVNNPIRLLAGWYMVVPEAPVPPLSLIMSYFAIGCYFMSLKRLSEYRALDDPALARTYRRSFAHYNQERLLATVMGYAAAAMLFFGAFAVRYRIETILAFPLIALVMAVYLLIALRPNSPVQNPERLYREPALTISCAVCAAALILLVLIDLPSLVDALDPDFTAPRKR